MASLLKRGDVYYAQYYVGKRQKRACLNTGILQIAKEKIRDIESALFKGASIPLPTKTTLGKVVEAYVLHMQTTKTADSAKKDISYLREVFGPVCPSLAIKNNKNSEKAHKHPFRNAIEVSYFEQVTTEQVSSFISAKVRERGIAPKTANRYREILTRLYNWAMTQNGINMPGNINPAAKVERYKERTPEITFLMTEHIQEQLKVHEDKMQLQVMVAMYIFAGLRREEALWLTLADVDLKDGMLRIRAKTINGRFWEPKTKDNRVVPISTSLRKYLDRYVPVPTSEGWFFTSPKGCQWNPDNFSHALSEANKDAGLEWTCLDYRHTFGSHLAMKGESLYKISKLMGNSPEICRRHYAALMPDSMIQSVEF